MTPRTSLQAMTRIVRLQLGQVLIMKVFQIGTAFCCPISLHVCDSRSGLRLDTIELFVEVDGLAGPPTLAFYFDFKGFDYPGEAAPCVVHAMQLISDFFQ